MVNLTASHWIGVSVDFPSHTIFYAEPLAGRLANSEVIEILRW